MKLRIPVDNENYIEVDTTGAISVSVGLKSEDSEYMAALDGITSLILAHVCENVDVMKPAYIRGVQVAIEAIINNHYEVYVVGP